MKILGIKYWGLFLLSGCSIPVFGQYTPDLATTQNTQGVLQYYYSIKKVASARTYTKLVYTRPNNQLMSWPNYPSTAEAVTRRMDQNVQNHKLQNIIAKDIIKSVFSKKKKNAIIPQY
ncbi:MAG: hypothetical protein WCG67_01670 [Ferruginibacter sp.]